LRRTPSSACAGYAVFAAAFALGTWLRVFHIGAQVVADDELHSLRALTMASSGYILTHFFLFAVSVPQTLLQIAIRHSIGLTETTVRLPMLAAGIASLVLIPLWTRRLFDAPTALLLAVLLAVSPQLVYSSRYGRPYMISTLFVFAAFCAFHSWWTEGGRGRAAGYVGCGALAVWFHLFTAATVAAPLAVAGAELLRVVPGTERRRAARGLLGVGFCLAAVVAALLAAPLATLDPSLTHKVGEGHAVAKALRGAAKLMAGTDRAWLAALFWAGVAAGAVVGLRRHPFVSRLLLAAMLCQLLAIWLVAPTSVETPAVLARYDVWLLPFALLFLSAAITELGALRIRGARWPLPALVGSAFTIALVAGGPLPALYAEQPDNFMNHANRQYSYRPQKPLPEREVPAFYRQLANEPGAFGIVETPWFHQWHSNRLDRYQRIHGKEVLIGFLPATPGRDWFPQRPFGEGLRFRLFVDLARPEALDGRAVRYLVVHKDLEQEMGSAYLPKRPMPELAPHLAEFTRRFGAPIYEDERIVAFRVGSAGQ
jgi:hypothetical protein